MTEPGKGFALCSVRLRKMSSEQGKRRGIICENPALKPFGVPCSVRLLASSFWTVRVRLAKEFSLCVAGDSQSVTWPCASTLVGAFGPSDDQIPRPGVGTARWPRSQILRSRLVEML